MTLIEALDVYAIDTTVPLNARIAMARAARELERLTEPPLGVKAATQPTWGWGDKRDMGCGNEG